MDKNLLYYGDNLDVMRRHMKDKSVDLVYLDPPFNSDANYNVLFREQDGSQASSQVVAFEDTWHWDQSAARAYEETVERGDRVADVMRAFRTFLGTSDMLAYLSMMAPRLAEIRRLMKSSASIYLHCDPTSSHYLKLLMDAVFGATNFQNEVIWKRTSAHSDSVKYGRVHDIILFYRMSGESTFNRVFAPYDARYIAKYYKHRDPDQRLFMDDNLTATGLSGGGYDYEWRGVSDESGVVRWRRWNVMNSKVESTIRQTEWHE